jgi:outer membrane protein assembly factor BamB
MGPRNFCRRSGRLFLWSAVGLVLLFGILIAVERYLLYHQPVVRVSNEALANELKNRALAQTSTAAVLPGEWPQWRGPRRDGVSTETGLLTSWPEGGLKVLWQADCGEGYSALAIAGGRAFTLWRDGGQKKEVVVCWDAATGAEQWRHDYPCDVSLPYGNGPRSTPTVDGNRVYTVGASGILHCLDTATGKVLWRKDLLDEYKAPNLQWGVSFSPLIEGDLLLTNPGGRNGHSIVALDKHTGNHVWAALDDPAGYSSPLAVNLAGVRQVLFFTGTALVSVTPDQGKLLWRFPWETRYEVNAATPIALDDYVFISSNYGMGCALLKVEKDASGGLKAEPVYQSTAMANHHPSSVLYREHLFGCSSPPGILTCLNFRTGEVAWTKRGFGEGTTVLAAAGHLIILSGDGRKLALAEATPEGYREKAALRGPDEKCWTMPVLADGRLYLRTQSRVICYDLKTP